LIEQKSWNFVETSIMPQEPSLNERVSEPERKVDQLRNQSAKYTPKPGWVRKIIGSMESDPDFAEILRLGREIRDAETAD
jgi:hypothetical protein